MAKTLFTLSRLEKDRVQSAKADPRNIGDFATLEEMIAHSLRTPAPLHSSPKLETRPFENDALLKKLLQYRSQIPVSARIIRPKVTES